MIFARIENKYSKQLRILFWVALLALAITGSVVLYLSTPKGMGLVNDSVGYVMGARSLLHGTGYSRYTGDDQTRPITNYPPLYSITIAAVSATGIDAVQATQCIGLVIFGLNALLVGLLLHRWLNSYLFALFGAGLFISSEAFLRVHTFAMSEPLYMLCSLLSMWLLAVYVKNQRKGLLVLTGVVASLAYLTRYLGGSLYALTLLTLWVFLPTWRQRLCDSALFLAGALPGAVLWMVRNQLLTGNSANRLFVYHPILPEQFELGARNFWLWLLPDSDTLAGAAQKAGVPALFLLIAGLFILALFLFVTILRRRTSPSPSLLVFWIVLVEGLGYLATLVFALTFLDASPIFEDRILFPFNTCLLLLLVMGLAWLWARPRWVWKSTAGVLALVLALFFLKDTRHAISELRMDAQGFASNAWRSSEVANGITQFPNRPIYTNRPTVLYILQNRTGYTLPAPSNVSSRLERPNYEKELAAIQKDILGRRGLMVIFGYPSMMDNPEDREYAQELTSGLPLLKMYADGAVFGPP